MVKENAILKNIPTNKKKKPDRVDNVARNVISIQEVMIQTLGNVIYFTPDVTKLPQYIKDHFYGRTYSSEQRLILTAKVRIGCPSANE